MAERKQGKNTRNPHNPEYNITKEFTSQLDQYFKKSML